MSASSSPSPVFQTDRRRRRRPQRWDRPFGDGPLTAEDVARVLALPVFRDIDPGEFPDHMRLDNVIANDAQIRRPTRGERLVREGDYGNSLFAVMSGSVSRVTSEATVSPGETVTVSLGAGEMFGETAALTRSPRTGTVVVEDDGTELVELRWQGVLELRRWSRSFRNHIDGRYREKSLASYLRHSVLFRHLNEVHRLEIAQQARFETYGDTEWFQRFRRTSESVGKARQREPLIAEEGHFLDGILIIRAGFARESRRLDQGERTIGFLGSDDVFGLEELMDFRAGKGDGRLRGSLRAIGYVDILNVPGELLTARVLPTLPMDALRQVAGKMRRHDVGHSLLSMDTRNQALLEFLIDHRLINGTAAMVIDQNLCVHCDDCVRACALTHGGQSRFHRRGHRLGAFMVAQSCMHCADPVCLIGCPTGAIHRGLESGHVMIDDATCIGCEICAQACPYGNIRMAEVRDRGGFAVVGDDHLPIQKAIKCDLCTGRTGGPACVAACPHAALKRVDLLNIARSRAWSAQ